MLLILPVSSHALCSNEMMPEDTNFDGVVTSADALLILNALNRGSSDSSGCLDANNSNTLEPADFLAVINYINRLSRKNYFRFRSELGEPAGKGRQVTLDNFRRNEFITHFLPHYVAFQAVSPSNSSDTYFLQFAGPTDNVGRLTVPEKGKTYSFNILSSEPLRLGPNQDGFVVLERVHSSGTRYGCLARFGYYTVHDVASSGFNKLERFHASFSYTCIESGATIRGEVNYTEGR